ncbi:hypothetical protein CcrBL47_gp288c [Caulobacter phage BL47]|nr:hypothetical protein CcrBL47_gp288c [Caulobacter phage BL47]
MSKETIFETAGDDGEGLGWTYDLIQALQAAQDLCENEDPENNLSFYAQDRSGREVKAVKVVKETLTDGSVAFTVVMDMDY